jgi:hypothetical protein
MEKKKRKWVYMIAYGGIGLCLLLALIGLVANQLHKHYVRPGEDFKYGNAAMGVDYGYSRQVSGDTACAGDLAIWWIDLKIRCFAGTSDDCALQLHAAVTHDNGSTWGSTWEDGVGGSWNPILVQLHPGEEQIYTFQDEDLCSQSLYNHPKKVVISIKDLNNTEDNVETFFQLKP